MNYKILLDADCRSWLLLDDRRLFRGRRFGRLGDGSFNRLTTGRGFRTDNRLRVFDTRLTDRLLAIRRFDARHFFFDGDALGFFALPILVPFFVLVTCPMLVMVVVMGSAAAARFLCRAPRRRAVPPLLAVFVAILLLSV